MNIKSKLATYTGANCASSSIEETRSPVACFKKSFITDRHGCAVEAYNFPLGPRRGRGDWCCSRQRAGIPSRHVSRFSAPSSSPQLTPSLRSVKTRLQVQVRSDATKGSTDADEQHYKSTWDAISRITAEDGVKGLYAGMNGALLGVASTNFAYFYWYTIVRTLYFKSRGSDVHPSTIVELALGAVAGAIAQIFTIPVAVVTTRQQTATKEDRKGLLATAREVIDGPDGVSGLWRGLKASLVLVVNPAITYGAYERLKDTFFPGKTTLRPAEAFRKFAV